MLTTLISALRVQPFPGFAVNVYVTRYQTICLALFLALLPGCAVAQGGNFLDHLRIGFGAGANTSQVIDLAPFNIYEDLTGQTYTSSYTGLLMNIGNQYFVQAEWYNDHFIVAMKPGTYTHRFSKINEVVFSNETVEQETSSLLRYITFPAEVRYNVDLNRYRPYAGLTVAYSHLLPANDAFTRTFIRPKISAGAVIGTYIDLRYVILDLNAGYRSGLHNIASKADRFGTDDGTAFAQDDLILNDLQVSLSILFSLQKQRRFSNVECYY